MQLNCQCLAFSVGYISKPSNVVKISDPKNIRIIYVYLRLFTFHIVQPCLSKLKYKRKQKVDEFQKINALDYLLEQSFRGYTFLHIFLTF